MVDEIAICESNLVQLARLALKEQPADVRLFIARLARTHRSANPELGRQLADLLRTLSPRPAAALRQMPPQFNAHHLKAAEPVFVHQQPPAEDALPAPLLDEKLSDDLSRIITERRESALLSRAGLTPTRSCLFIGPPGVGKTMAAGWIASELDLPLRVVDLGTLMSGILGGSAANLRAVFASAKDGPCVLFLDEIDAIAKRRADDADVGEAKRLVTALLQELDGWPATGLLLAATNHPELLDPAAWRRFEAVIHFRLPEGKALRQVIRRFLASDLDAFEEWVDVLALSNAGRSPADIENLVLRMRRSFTLGEGTAADIARQYVETLAPGLNRAARKDLAVELAAASSLSQRAVSKLTGVSRDTLRTHVSGDKHRPRGVSGSRHRSKHAMAAE